MGAATIRPSTCNKGKVAFSRHPNGRSTSALVAPAKLGFRNGPVVVKPWNVPHTPVYGHKLRELLTCGCVVP
jgi:hypothetical protein